MRIYPILVLLLSVAIAAMPGLSDSKEMVRPSGYEGKWFAGPQDPGHTEYDLALRNYLVQRIQKRFGVGLDPKTYSGFDLLEIEALFSIKKSNEPFDLFLKMFPKNP